MIPKTVAKLWHDKCNTKSKHTQHDKSRIKKIKHQTLLITGDMDRLTPKSASIWLESHLKESQLKLIKGASHIPFLSHSDEFFNCLDQFLLAA